MAKLHGNSTSSGPKPGFRYDAGNLQEPLSPKEVCAKWRPEWVSPPGGSHNLASALTYECVINGSEERHILGE